MPANILIAGMARSYTKLIHPPVSSFYVSFVKQLLQ
jgi:hypothetical protein